MKSLEMVNNTIVNQQTIEVKGNDKLPSIFVDDIRIAGVKWNDSPDENYISIKLNTHYKVISVKNLEQIKQDLEVLEILRKYLYLYTYIADADYGDREDRTIQMNMIEEMVSNWDYTQVKQWLEENE